MAEEWSREKRIKQTRVGPKEVSLGIVQTVQESKNPRESPRRKSFFWHHKELSTRYSPGIGGRREKA